MRQIETVPLKIQKIFFLSFGGNSVYYILLKPEPEGEACLKWVSLT